MFELVRGYSSSADIIKQKLPNNRIEVLVNGIDENIGKDGISDQGYFFFLGRLSNEKGVATMAKAYQMSKQSIPLKVAGACKKPPNGGISTELDQLT